MTAGLDPVALRAAIIRLREVRGWATFRLAKRAGVNDSYLRQIEAGKGARPGIDVVARVARAPGMSTDELLAEAGFNGPVTGWPSNAYDVLLELATRLDGPALEAAEEVLQSLVHLRERYSEDGLQPTGQDRGRFTPLSLDKAEEYARRMGDGSTPADDPPPDSTPSGETE